MNVQHIIEATKNTIIDKIKTFDTTFYRECVEVLSDPKTIRDLTETRIIKEKHILESIKIHIELNFDDYICFIADRSVLDDQTKGKIIKHNVLMRDLGNLSEKVLHNLLRQFHCLEIDNLDGLLEDNVLDRYREITHMVMCIGSNTDNRFNMNIVMDGIEFFQIKNKASLGLFLGIEVHKFLALQDLDRFVTYTKSTDVRVKKSVDRFKQMYRIHNLLRATNKQYILDRIMLFSGFVLHSLGTSYTEDADIMYSAKDQTKREIEDIKHFFDGYDGIDLFVYDENDSNVDYIDNLMTDPEKHYYFMGIKILCIKSYLRRLYQRASPSSFVDLIMLNKINGIKITPCFPVITVDEKNMIVYTKKTIEKKLHTVQKYFKEWHNIDYPMTEIKGMIKRCQNYPNDPPFYRSFRSDPMTQHIEYLIHRVILNIMNKYFIQNNDPKYVLIVDDAKEYPKYYPAKKSNMNVTVIEPDDSKSSPIFIKMSEARKHKNSSYKMIQGDVRRTNEFNKFPHIANKFSYILFKFNIHNMMNQIDNVIQNLNTYSDSKSVIVICYVDGDVVNRLIGAKDRFEILDDDQMTVFGLYKYDDQIYLDENTSEQKATRYNQFVLYLRETLRYGHGVVERILTTQNIMDTFGAEYKMIKDDQMINFDDPEIHHIKSNLSDVQCTIAEVFRYMILQRK